MNGKLQTTKKTMSTPLVIPSLFSLLSLTASAVDIVIAPLNATGPRVERWGWDLKAFADRIDTPGEAQKLYGDLPANLVRFPIFADAHFQNGTVDARANSPFAVCPFRKSSVHAPLASPAVENGTTPFRF